MVVAAHFHPDHSRSFKQFKTDRRDSLHLTRRRPFHKSHKQFQNVHLEQEKISPRPSAIQPVEKSPPLTIRESVSLPRVSQSLKVVGKRQQRQRSGEVPFRTLLRHLNRRKFTTQALDDFRQYHKTGTVPPPPDHPKFRASAEADEGRDFSTQEIEAHKAAWRDNHADEPSLRTRYPHTRFYGFAAKTYTAADRRLNCQQWEADYRRKWEHFDLDEDGVSVIYRVPNSQKVLRVVPSDNAETRRQLLNKRGHALSFGLGNSATNLHHKLGNEYVGITRNHVQDFVNEDDIHQLTKPFKHTINKPILPKKVFHRFAIDLIEMNRYTVGGKNKVPPHQLAELHKARKYFFYLYVDTEMKDQPLRERQAMFKKLLRDRKSNPRNKYLYILSCIDYFSKLFFAVALTSKRSWEVAYGMKRIMRRARQMAGEGSDETIRKECRYIYPTFCMSDNGTEFRSFFQLLLKTFNIKQIHTLSYSPQSNGLVENANKHLRGLIRSLTAMRNSNEWAQYLNKLCRNKNLQRNSTTRFSPLFLADIHNLGKPRDEGGTEEEGRRGEQRGEEGSEVGVEEGEDADEDVPDDVSLDIPPSFLGQADAEDDLTLTVPSATTESTVDEGAAVVVASGPAIDDEETPLPVAPLPSSASEADDSGQAMDENEERAAAEVEVAAKKPTKRKMVEIDRSREPKHCHSTDPTPFERDREAFYKALDNLLQGRFEDSKKAAEDEVAEWVRKYPFFRYLKQARENIETRARRVVGQRPDTIFEVGDFVRVRTSSLYSSLRRMIKQGEKKNIMVTYSPEIFQIRSVLRKSRPDLEDEEEGMDRYENTQYTLFEILSDRDARLETEKAEIRRNRDRHRPHLHRLPLLTEIKSNARANQNRRHRRLFGDEMVLVRRAKDTAPGTKLNPYPLDMDKLNLMTTTSAAVGSTKKRRAKKARGRVGEVLGEPMGEVVGNEEEEEGVVAVEEEEVDEDKEEEEEQSRKTRTMRQMPTNKTKESLFDDFLEKDEALKTFFEKVGRKRGLKKTKTEARMEATEARTMMDEAADRFFDETPRNILDRVFGEKASDEEVADHFHRFLQKRYKEM